MKKEFGLVPLKEERLERKLVLAFGFMSFIPILILVWTMVYTIDLTITVRLVIASACVGYFFVARKMIASVLTLAQKAKEISSGRVTALLDVDEHNEIGELARAFNRITQELEQKINELQSSRQLVRKLLSRIGTAIVSYEGIDTILDLIVENMVSALQAQMGSLLLVDGEQQELYVKTTWSSNGERANPAQRVKLGDGISGWVAREGRPMRGKGRANALGFVNTDAKDSAVLCVPMRLRDHTIGVVSIMREDASSPFTEDDEALLESISSQVAVAIENYRLNLDVEHTYLETIVALALAVEAKDPYSAGHSKRVGFYAMKIGEELGVDGEMLKVLNDAGVLHDIGKIGIRDDILLKPNALTSDERKIMEQHPLIGEAIVRPVRSLAKVVTLVRHHHEQYDGTGYPTHLKGDAIPLGARILSVADAYDSMVTERPYRARLTVDQAKAELQQAAGRQLDPEVVKAFLRVLAKKELHLPPTIKEAVKPT